MFFGFWSWFLVVIVVAAIFYANKLPQLRKQAEEKIKIGVQEGKVLWEKSSKELAAKTAVLAEKAKEKAEQNQAKGTTAAAEEKTEITAEDLAFMPTETEKKTEKPTKAAKAKKAEAKEESGDEAEAVEEKAEEKAEE